MKLSSHIPRRVVFGNSPSSFHFSLIKGGISGTLIPWSIDMVCFFPPCKGGGQRPIRALGHWPWLWKTLLGGDLMREIWSCSGIEEKEHIYKGQLEADMWKERSNVALHVYTYSMMLHCTIGQTRLGIEFGYPLPSYKVRIKGVAS